MPSSPALVLPFDSPLAALETVGGKGANLARLSRAGYPVPGGFLITVAAYHQYVGANGLEPRILSALSAAALDQPEALEQVSAQIRSLFCLQGLPSELEQAVLAAYREMGPGPVAVRSSATAEDLPELSFAGQQDTYLNIQGEPELLDAVVRCWSSLWTARAVGYRARQQVSQAGLGLAVVVQQMVPSQVSGVMFTANPLTGLRTEIVIDATFGLGEALVSGQVEPDRYLVDLAQGCIREKRLGQKALAIHGRPGGGTQTVRADAASLQALPDEQILALAGLGGRVAAEYGFPQDIEWGWAGGKLYLLQSRPITSLFPIPANPHHPDELRAYFSFGAVQGMFEPFTPLGADMIRMAFAGGSGLYGFQRDEQTQTVVYEAAGRLWCDFTALLRNPVGRKIARGAMRAVEPSVGEAMDLIWDDPRFLPTDRHIKLTTVLRVARLFVPMAFSVLATLARPTARRQTVLAMLDRELDLLQAELAAIQGTPAEKLASRARIYRRVTQYFARIVKVVIPLIAGAMSQFYYLRGLGGQLDALDGGRQYTNLAMDITRGVEGNVTTQMDLSLWSLARGVKADPPSLEAVQTLPAGEITTRYWQRNLPPALMDALDRFLGQYGLRGMGEIDMAHPRWADDPTHVIQVLGSYLQIDDESMAPDVVFARGREAALKAAQELPAAARRLPHGWMHSRRARFAVPRVRALIGAREAPKFFVVRLSGLVRQALLDSGRDFTRLGVFDHPEDIFFLSIREVEALAAGEERDWRALIAPRRAAFEREQHRRQLPRLLLSDGRAFYEGVSAPAGAGPDGIHGDPVSPGLVVGRVRVVLDPRGTRLEPGEILVCPGTDPSWTPLFLAAGGLVMETGGMMTHGAVVAREYGIPAVVGVDRATARLKTGQSIRLNGSTGEVTLLED